MLPSRRQESGIETTGIPFMLYIYREQDLDSSLVQMCTWHAHWYQGGPLGPNASMFVQDQYAGAYAAYLL